MCSNGKAKKRRRQLGSTFDGTFHDVPLPVNVHEFICYPFALTDMLYIISIGHVSIALENEVGNTWSGQELHILNVNIIIVGPLLCLIFGCNNQTVPI